MLKKTESPQSKQEDVKKSNTDSEPNVEFNNSKDEQKKSNITFQTLSNSDEVIRNDSSSRMLRKSRDATKTLITHFKNKNITVTEDRFGIYTDDNSNNIPVQRFTWSNHNAIEIQIITYGARITSMKIPNKKGVVEDIVLGFDDLASYLKHDHYFFGATIGRVTDVVENSTFVIDGKQYWVTPNYGDHHFNGGFKGLDKVVWDSCVNNSQVVLSYIIPDGHEGFPGDLMVSITFELSTKNEFSVNMEAVSTKPTIVNLSNLCYFNLAGHGGGPNELYKHIVTINSNSYTNMTKNNLPTGQILNSVFTKYNFQIPTLLKLCMGTETSDGFDQNLCVNREQEEDDCFVARALHIPSGRMLEIYSNQYGVRFNTGNNIQPLQNVNIFQIHQTTLNELLAMENYDIESTGNCQDVTFQLLVDIYQKMKEIVSIDEHNFEEILELLKDLHGLNMENILALFNKKSNTDTEFQEQVVLAAVFKARELVKHYVPSNTDNVKQWGELKSIVNGILATFRNLDDITRSFTCASETVHSNKDISSEELKNVQLQDKMSQSVNSKIGKKVSLNLTGSSLKLDPEQLPNASDEITEEWVQKELQKQIHSVILERKNKVFPKLKPPDKVPNLNIVGKNGVIYAKHSGMAFQTQNYPNAIYHKNFPNCVLRPNETYRHKIIYKFWVQSGNANKWIQRECG